MLLLNAATISLLGQVLRGYLQNCTDEVKMFLLIIILISLLVLPIHFIKNILKRFKE